MGAVIRVGVIILLLLGVGLAFAQSSPAVFVQPGATPAGGTIIQSDIFVRSGPGRQFLPVGQLVAGDAVVPLARNAEATWVLIQLRRGFGWILRDLADWQVDIDALPIIDEANLTPSAPDFASPVPVLSATPTPQGNWVFLVEDAQSAYVRAGPGRTYLRLGQLSSGATVEPVARSADGNWIMIRFERGFGWLARSLVRWTTPLDGLPVVSEANLTPSATFTATPSATRTPRPTATATASVTPTPTMSATPTPTGTASPTPTTSATSTATVTASPTPTASATMSTTPTGTASPTASATSTATVTASPTPTATASATFTLTPSLTATATATPSATASVTPVPPTVVAAALATTAAPMQTATLTRTSTSTATATVTLTPTVSATPTATVTLTPTVTVTPSATATATATLSPSPSATTSPTASQTSTVAAVLLPAATEVPVTPTLAATTPPGATATTVPTITATVAGSGGAEPTAAAPGTPVPSSVAGLPPEALLGGGLLLAAALYAGLYGWGLLGMRRYAAGFVIQECPVCKQGHLTAEARAERILGIPRARHLVRCDHCRSLLRETRPRTFRYAVDPLANRKLYQRYNGRELDETALMRLVEAEKPGVRVWPPADPPTFTDNEP